MSLATNTVTDTVATGGRIGENLLPWANAGPDQLVTAPSPNGMATVKLDGSGSSDPDGQIASYTWSKNGIVITNGVSPTVALPVGTNVILLTVADTKGGTGRGEVTIIVLAPLTVTISANPTNASSSPLTVQSAGQATGGVPAPLPYDTTDDHQGTVSAAGENNGINGNYEVATNAFDDTPAKWLDFANANPGTRASWIQYQYPNGLQRVVTNYTLTSANDSPERDPANWALLASNNGGTNWTTLDVQTGQVFSDRYQLRSYPVPSPAAYNIYRLRIDRVADPSTAVAVQLSEIQLLGTQKYTYAWSFGDGKTVYSESVGVPDQQQHTYSNNGSYTVTLAATYGPYSGTNTTKINIGAPLSANISISPSTNGSAPFSVQFFWHRNRRTG